MKNEFPAYVYAWHMLNAPLDLAGLLCTQCVCVCVCVTRQTKAKRE